jgi:hypothetical protein
MSSPAVREGLRKGGTWFVVVLNVMAEKVIMTYCPGIAPNIFGTNKERTESLIG